MINFLMRFHQQASSHITGMTTACGEGREWEYLLVVATLKSSGLHPIREYIRRRKTPIAEKVECCPIYELCVEVDWRPGTIHMMIWWDQDVVNEPEE